MTGIICAMDLEAHLLLNEMRDTKCERISGIDFVCGTLYGRKSVIAVCGVGKENSVPVDVEETGFVNNTIMPLLGMEGFDWYTASEYWPFILTITYLWKHAGYNAIVYMASISGIDRGIFEAAEIDGANKIQQIFRITLPMLKPTITIMVLMAIGRVFYSDFGLFYQIPMDSGQLYSVTQTIDTYVYRGLMQNANVSLSAAAGFYQSICGFLLVVGANKLVKIFDSDNALF